VFVRNVQRKRTLGGRTNKSVVDYDICFVFLFFTAALGVQATVPNRSNYIPVRGKTDNKKPRRGNGRILDTTAASSPPGPTVSNRREVTTCSYNTRRYKEPS